MVELSRWAWLKPLVFSAVLLGLGGFIGQLWDHPALALGLTALGLLAWQYWQRQRIIYQLIYRQYHLPRTSGAWNTARYLLYHNQQDHRARQRRLRQHLQAYRTVAAALPDAVIIIERIKKKKKGKKK